MYYPRIINTRYVLPKISLILLLFGCLFYFSNPVFGQDNIIEYAAKFTGDGKTFFQYQLETDKIKKLRLIQNETGHLLKSYQLPETTIYHFEFDLNKKRILLISHDGIYHMDFLTGDLLEKIPYNANLETEFKGYSYSMTEDKFDFYDDMLLIKTVNQVFLMNPFSGEVITQVKLQENVDNVWLIDQENSVLFTTDLGSRVAKLDLKTKKISELGNVGFFNVLKLSENREEAIFVNAETVNTFDIRSKTWVLKNSIKKNNNIFISIQDAVVGDGGFVFSTGKSSFVSYDNPSSDFSDYNTFPHLITGLDYYSNRLLLFNQDYTYIYDIYGQEISRYFNASVNTPLFYEAELTLSEVYENDISALSRVDGKLAIGTTAGKLKLGELDSTYLSTAITYLEEINQKIIIGGYSRMITVDPKSTEVEKVFRGFEGNVIHKAQRANDPYFFLQTQNDLIYLVSNEGEFIEKIAYSKPIEKFSITDKKLEVQHADFIETTDFSFAINNHFDPPLEILFSQLHQYFSKSLIYDPSGDYIFSFDNKELKLWDSKSLTVLKNQNLSSISNAIFSQNGKEIIAYSLTKIFLLDAKTLQIKKEYPISRLAYSGLERGLNLRHITLANENLAIFSDIYGILYYLNLNTGFFSKWFYPEQKAVFGLAYSKKRDAVLIYGNDAILAYKLNDIENPIFRIPYPSDPRRNIYTQETFDLSPDEKYLLVANSNDVLHLIDLQKEEIIWETKHKTHALFLDNSNFLTVEESEKRIASLYKYNISDLSNPEVIKEFGLQTMSYAPIPNSIANNTITNELAFLYSNGFVESFDYQRKTSLKNIKNGIINANGKFNPNNGQIHIGYPNKIKIFDWLRGTYEREITSKTRGGSSPNFMFSPSGQYFIIIYSNLIRFFNSDGSKELFTLDVEKTYSINFNKDESKIVLWDYLGEFQVLDLATQEILFTKNQVEGEGFKYLKLVEFDETDDLLVIGSEDADKTVLYGTFEKNRLDNFERYDGNSGKLKENFIIETFLAESPILIKDKLYFQSHYGELSRMDINTKEIFKARFEGSIDKLFHSYDSNSFLVGDDNGLVHIMDINSLESTSIWEGTREGKIRTIEHYQNYSLVNFDNRGSLILNNKSKENIFHAVMMSNEGYLFYRDDGYYSGSTNISDAIYFKDGNAIYSFDQYDVKYNRPDLLISSVPEYDKNLADAYYHAYKKRLNRLKIDERKLEGEISLPQVYFVSDLERSYDKKEISLVFEAIDEVLPITSYNIWINEVPIFGQNGKTISNTTQETIQIKEDILLSEGINTIRIAASNSDGITSNRPSITTYFIPQEPYKPKLYYIGLGVDRYVQNNYNLNYAAKDIRDLALAFKDIYGENAIIDTLFDEAVNVKALEKIKVLLAQTNVEDQVIISFSGHGLLNDDFDYYLATHQIDFDQPDQLGIPFEEFEALLDMIPARKKLMLIDACHSGEVDKEELEEIQQFKKTEGMKGSTSVSLKKPKLGSKNTFELMQELFANLNKGTGATIISASAGTEFALEKSSLANGLFTYSILELMQEYPEMNVSQLKDLVGERVLELSNGLQKPTSRKINMELDWKIW
ncbi:WD40 repeat-containing protein [Belliella baltica DSM 15883]|uniref:WD40 repeat-containing protein n=1 Tax=Belliella baltica (strain DSM 15883 / CIP 108006 / LMG 21964 / BA134) TaxID=866536 RepID=I3Z1Y4_BELBD|nr:WD40 repeat domain-containing protein [Belliella baltica]AFL83252.1 WD40 repeat-containing protein [Belliella baltica DSM 15883]